MRHTRLIWMMLSSLLVAACQSDDEARPTDNRPQADIYLSTSMSATNDLTITRVWPGEYSEYMPADGSDDKIRLFFVSMDPQETYWPERDFSFDPAEGKKHWHNQRSISAGNYKIYGFIPVSAVPSNATKPTIAYNSEADKGTMTIYGLSSASTTDVCVIAGVVKGAALNDIGDVTPTRGTYAYTATVENNYMYVLLDHIYTELALQFCVDETYAQLRKIKLKKVTMTTDRGDATATVTCTTGHAPSISFAIDTEHSEKVELFNNSNGVWLPYAGVLDVPAFFTPISSGTTRNIDILSEYDVYDRYDNLVRENCEAHNTIKITNLTSGDRIKIKAKVTPTYLYQLGNYDLDATTIKTSTN